MDTTTKNSLTFVRSDGHDKNRNGYAIYDCECGKQKRVRVSDVNNGKIQSCGCGAGRPKIVPLSQNNRLSFLSRTPSTDHGSRALYQCACGKTIDTYIYRVNNGTVASCGCLREEINRQRHEEAISGDEESRLARLRRESLKKAKKARMKEVYIPRDARLPTEDGLYEDWIRNEFARLSLSGRKARIVWIDDRIGLWAQTSDPGQAA